MPVRRAATYSAGMTRLVDDRRSRLNAELAWGLALLALYLSVQAVVRWLRRPLFHGHGAYGWAQASPLEFSLLLLVCAVPFVALLALVYVLSAGRITGRARLLAVYAGLLALLAVIELDMSWYALSRRHIGVAEVQIFLTESWGRHVGIRPADVTRFVRLMTVHLIAFAAIAIAARWWCRAPREVRGPRASRVAACAAILLCVDLGLVGSAMSRDAKQWRTVATMHPLRVALVDESVARWLGRGEFIDGLNARLAASEAVVDPGIGNPLIANGAPPRQAGARHHVIVIALEGLNARYTSDIRSLDALRPTAIEGTRHYSTGNATHYGLLGLTHGRSMLFYGRANKPASSWIDRFNAAGYRTKRFGADVTVFGQIGQYVGNFSDPTLEPDADWDVPDALHRYLRDGTSPKVAVVYYGGTHWPYRHRPEYSRHQPEVPEDFDYTRTDLADFAEQIRNRYRNCIDELDAWLGTVLAQVDLDRTIVVVTGDHGEELLEHGRLSHAGGLFQGQIGTSLLVHVPGATRRQIDAVTSHAHVLPAVAAWLGLAEPVDETTRPGTGVALAAQNNHTSTPKEWAVIDPMHKILFGLDAAGRIEITDLVDHADRPIREQGALDPALLDRTLSALRAWVEGAGAVGGAGAPRASGEGRR